MKKKTTKVLRSSSPKKKVTTLKKSLKKTVSKKKATKKVTTFRNKLVVKGGKAPKPIKLSKPISEIRFLIENFYDIQDNRIRADGRSRAWKQVYKMKDTEQKVYRDNIGERFKGIEEWIYKELNSKVKAHPLWDAWLKHVKGIGPALAGGYLAWIGDIGRFETISALHAYMGLHCDENGKAVRKRKGVQANWHQRLKMHAWKTAKAFVKTNGKYRGFYDRTKKKYQKAHPKEVKIKIDGTMRTLYTKGHIDNMAMRKTVKLFISHLWLQWRTLEGFPTRSPYPLEQLGHTTFIEPYFDTLPTVKKVKTVAKKKKK